MGDEVAVLRAFADCVGGWIECLPDGEKAVDVAVHEDICQHMESPITELRVCSLFRWCNVPMVKPEDWIESRVVQLRHMTHESSNCSMD